MSQYYRPRQQQGAPSEHSYVLGDNEREQCPLQVDLEDSIYIFPNPSSSTGSAPSSPSLSSDISIPSDFTLSRMSRSRSRNSSDRGSSRSINGRMPINIGRRFNVGADGDPELEIGDQLGAAQCSQSLGDILHMQSNYEIDWNMEMDSVVVSDGASADLEEVVKANRWKLLVPQQYRRDLSSSLWRVRQQQLDYATSRTASVPWSVHRRHRSVDSDPGSIVRHRQKHVPLLSFFASLLFIDESTIRLLTRPSFESSTSFVGHSYSDDHPSDEHDAPYDASRLFAGSDEFRTLKKGLAVALDPDFLPSNPFALPSLRPSRLWNLAHIVWAYSGRARQELCK